MLDEFLTTVEVLVSPQEFTFDEELETMVVTKDAEYRTQTILAQRPETKTQADLDRVLRLGKPASVVGRFKTMVDLGIAWDWCEDYISYLNEVDTWEKWESEDILDEEGEVVGQTGQPPKPTEPVRQQAVQLSYKAQRVAAYPSLAEFADAFVHLENGDKEPMEAYVAKCNEIKTAFPKS